MFNLESQCVLNKKTAVLRSMYVIAKSDFILRKLQIKPIILQARRNINLFCTFSGHYTPAASEHVFQS